MRAISEIIRDNIKAARCGVKGAENLHGVRYRVVTTDLAAVEGQVLARGTLGELARYRQLENHGTVRIELDDEDQDNG